MNRQAFLAGYLAKTSKEEFTPKEQTPSLLSEAENIPADVTVTPVKQTSTGTEKPKDTAEAKEPANTDENKKDILSKIQAKAKDK